MTVSAALYEEEDLPLQPARGVLRQVRIRVLPSAFAICFGMVMSLCMQGYRFGESNHTVYLLDALRSVDETLLGNDWFATRTLQYHVVFGTLSEVLLRLGILEPGFLVGYLLLLLAWHVAWFRLVHALGGTRMTYLLSVLLFFLLAGGTGLGMYSFMQDSSFLPSNIANVALLWGIYFWISGKRLWSGAWIGVAGLMHLNHALVGGGLWVVLLAWDWWRPTGGANADEPNARRKLVWATCLALGLSAVNVGLALTVRPAEAGEPLPLSRFVDLYVRLRHPHHYDPSTWPIALWVCFLLPLVPAGVAWWWMRHTPPWRSAGRITAVFAGLTLVALVGAGVWYVSERLVQLSLYRFTIYIKLLGCIGCAYFCYNAGGLKRKHLRVAMLMLPVILIVGAVAIVQLERYHLFTPVARWVWRQRGTIGLMLILTAALTVYELIYARMRHVTSNLLHGGGIAALALIVLVAWNRWLGVGLVPSDDADYLRLCQWAKANTPVDAVFLVPPQEQAFRLHAQRAIVINFKGVAQLSSELRPWEKRLCDVLGLPDLRRLERPFNRTLQDIARRYHARPAAALMDVAQAYHADYLVATRRLEIERSPVVVFGSYFLYDLHGHAE
jgi:hypothetical protein